MSKGKAVVFYTDAEISALTEISTRPKDKWLNGIREFSEQTDSQRTLDSLWQKVYSISKGAVSKRKKPVAKSLVKVHAGLPQKEIPIPRQVVATKREIRFPYKGIRLEEGHVVITL